MLASHKIMAFAPTLDAKVIQRVDQHLLQRSDIRHHVALPFA